MRTLFRILRSQPARLMLRALVTAFGVMVVTFVLVRLIPGDPVDILFAGLGGEDVEATADAYRETLGLNGSILEQGVRYARNVATGDLGNSLVTQQPIAGIVGRTLPVTASLIAVSVAMSLVFALPVAVVVAVFRDSWFERLFRVVSSISLAMPGFYLGLLLILLFGIRLNLAPVAGYEPGFPQNLYYLWLPALTMSAVLIPILTRVLASSISVTLDEEFVEAAVSRGLPRRTLIWRYLMRPSIAPTLVLLSYIMGQMLGASVVIEMVFNLPGIGTALILEGVLPRDYTVVQGIVLVFGVVVVFVSFAADVVSRRIDPRVDLR